MPTRDDGEYLCHRECKDGSACLRTVPFGGNACYQHRGHPLLSTTEEN
ncbi:hypothetical protein [Haloarchaeobius sp. DFWS5]